MMKILFDPMTNKKSISLPRGLEFFFAIIFMLSFCGYAELFASYFFLIFNYISVPYY